MQSGRLIQADLDRRFKETGVENVVSSDADSGNICLEKEADHIEGFAPEVAWVTHGGMEETAGEILYPSYIRDAVLRSVGKNCTVLQRSSKGMESVEFRASLGEDNKTIPSFQRVPVAGRTYDSCNI